MRYPQLLLDTHDEILVDAPRASGRFVDGHHYSPETQIQPGERRSPATEVRPGQRLSPRTEFKPGAEPHNKKPLGSVTIRIDMNGNQREWVKIGEPSKWRQRAVVVWEREHNRALPRGYVVHHRDRDSLNDEPENLVALTRKEHALEHLEEVQASGFGGAESLQKARRARRVAS